MAKNALVVGSSQSNINGLSATGSISVSPSSLLGSQSKHKNILQTSNLLFIGLSDFSGRGPTKDGRIKPDVVAPGEWLTTANKGAQDNSCEFKSVKGTSFAAGKIKISRIKDFLHLNKSRSCRS
jgi:hypothetical protein